jgi:diguanylate cyclase (GGDEF)-like protein
MSPTSATEVAFLVVALMQGMFALLWAIAASLVVQRRPLVHWAAWSGLSAITWLTLSFSIESPPLLGVVAGIVGVAALERGVCLFIGRSTRDRLHLALLALVVIANLSLLDPTTRHFQAVINYGVLAGLYLNVARDMYVYARGALQWRWAVILAIPVAIASLMCALRVVSALVDPNSVVEVMATDSALNLRTAFLAVGLAMTLHSTLVGLVVARLVTELQRLSRHDALTGLLNRRAMEEALDTQLRRSQRTNEPFVVMMLDLDHFKRINDRHGHPVGDLALKHVASLLRAAMRASDSLGRFGGEEFVLLLPDTPLGQAEAVAEKVRHLFEQSPLADEAMSVPLSASIGVAQWRAGDDISRLLSRADAALFQAKVQGRNRVVTAMDAAAVVG